MRKWATWRRRAGRVLLGAILFGSIELSIADSCDVVSRSAATVTAARDASDAPTHAPAAPQLTGHLCHCLHVHGSAPPARLTPVARVARVERDRFPGADRRPADPILEPRLRPPLTQTA